MCACISPTSSRSRSDDRPTSASFSMRLCTARIACSLVVQASNSVVSTSTRCSIICSLPALLPRRPRSSSTCSAIWRRLSPRAPCDLVLDVRRRVHHDALEQRAALRHQLVAQRLLERRQAALRHAGGIAVDACGERLARRQRVDALHVDAEDACRLAALRVDLVAHLLGRRERVDERVDLVQHDEARERVGAEVVTPDREVRLGDAGVGPEDEDGRVRSRQQAQGQLGLRTDRVQARRVEDHQPCLSSGCG